MQTLIQLPEKLSKKEVDNINYVFSQMSLTAKQGFLASLILQYPEHYADFISKFGTEYSKAMAKA